MVIREGRARKLTVVPTPSCLGATCRIGYYKRSDLPLHFALAEGWTVADSYYEAVIASTTPNRVSWASGSINVPGGPQTPDQGG